MQRTRFILRNSFISLVITTLIGAFPGAAYATADSSAEDVAAPTTQTTDQPPATPPADETPATTVSTPPPAPPAPAPSPTPSPAPTTTSSVPQTGPQQPTGADASKYTYNESTGLWENDVYAWNPSTGQTQPKTTQDYSYNPSANMWETTEWQYDAPTGTYKPNVTAAQQPPAGIANNSPATNAVPQDSPTALSAQLQKILGQNPGSSHTSTNGESLPTISGAPSNGSTATANGPLSNSSNSAVTDDPTHQHIYDLFYNANISNTVNSTAQSGDVELTKNTIAGDAETGSALAMATLLNLLNSSWNPLGGLGLSTFMADIFGDVVGDLLINPDTIPENQYTNGDDPLATDINITADSNAQINNDVTLNAQSGNATVASNTSAGDATTGDAHAVANLVNLMNSAITANQSFLGMLNIYGSLDGDILLPPQLFDTLLAANPPATTLDSAQIENADILAKFSDNQQIRNDINTSAITGDAIISDNTSAGDAVSGDALNNVTVLNLTGRQVIGKNALLVFVNVHGEWVGLIMDAPAGTTTATLGGGISDNIALPEAQLTGIEVNNSGEINNNLSLAAQSGDAFVHKNTNAGDAVTGDATTSANIANITNSQFSLSDWFGILFINVFGKWNGSFGVNTSAGTLPLPNPITTPQPSTGNVALAQQVAIFQFIPGENAAKTRIVPVQSAHVSSATHTAVTSTAQASNGPTEETEEGFVLTTSTTPTASGSSTSESSSTDVLLPIVGLFIGSFLLAAERIVTIRQRRLQPQRQS